MKKVVRGGVEKGDFVQISFFECIIEKCKQELKNTNGISVLLLYQTYPLFALGIEILGYIDIFGEKKKICENILGDVKYLTANKGAF